MSLEKKQYLINELIDMEPNDQLEFTKSLLDNLYFNEISQDKTDNYNIVASKELREIITDYAYSLEDKIKKDYIVDMLNKLKNLSSSSQEKVMHAIFPDLLDSIEEMEEFENITKCGEKGHQFNNSGWIKTEWIDKKDFEENKFFLNVKWTRECTNCGYIETSYINPMEIKRDIPQQLKKELHD